MTQTVSTTPTESTMHIPASVLGIILDTSNVKQAGVLKSLTEAFLQHIPLQERSYVGMFLIATADGTAFPINVSSETFERQWQEIPWGGKSDVTPGLTAMQNVIQQYTKPNTKTPVFRTLLLTDSPPADWTAFRTALEQLGRVEIGVLGEGETQLKTFAGYRGAISYTMPVTLSLINQEYDATTWAGALFRSLE